MVEDEEKKVPSLFQSKPVIWSHTMYHLVDEATIIRTGMHPLGDSLCHAYKNSFLPDTCYIIPSGMKICKKCAKIASVKKHSPCFGTLAYSDCSLCDEHDECYSEAMRRDMKKDQAKKLTSKKRR